MQPNAAPPVRFEAHKCWTPIFFCRAEPYSSQKIACFPHCGYSLVCVRVSSIWGHRCRSRVCSANIMERSRRRIEYPRSDCCCLCFRHGLTYNGDSLRPRQIDALALLALATPGGAIHIANAVNVHHSSVYSKTGEAYCDNIEPAHNALGQVP